MSQEKIHSMETIREVPYYLAVTAKVAGIHLVYVPVLLQFDSFHFRICREFLDETAA
jgi:hypothetical protein